MTYSINPGAVATRKYRDEHPERNRASRQKAKARNRRIVREAKEGNPCVDCGGYFEAVAMDFDHVRGSKVGSVATAIKELWSAERLLNEIAKCELRCANCHRVKTAREAGWDDVR